MNLLPAENRRSNSRAIYVPAFVLAAAALLCAVALAAISPVKDREYLRALENETARLQPLARKAGEIERAIEATRAKARQLDDLRRHSKSALDALAEVNKVLEPPAYLNSLDMAQDSITIAGSAERAEPLLKMFDNSPPVSGVGVHRAAHPQRQDADVPDPRHPQGGAAVTLTERDKRALAILGIGGALAVVCGLSAEQRGPCPRRPVGQHSRRREASGTGAPAGSDGGRQAAGFEPGYG